METTNNSENIPQNSSQSTDTGGAPTSAQNESQKPVGNASFEHSKLDVNSHQGAEKLAAEYNINEKAHFDSSEADFIKTVSNFNRANTDTPNETDSRNHS